MGVLLMPICGLKFQIKWQNVPCLWHKMALKYSNTITQSQIELIFPKLTMPFFGRKELLLCDSTIYVFWCELQ